ncbi:MAG: MFS transporter [Halanaerobiales bacterium]|nr:MFS transporter [Halanaerobiales bacterium]
MNEYSLEMKKEIRSFRLFNFIFYMSFAVLAFRNVYLREVLGMPGTEIGIINSIGKLVIFLTLPLWGVLVDLKKAQKRLLQLALFGSMVVFSFVGLADHFLTVALMFGMFYFFQGPIVPVTDSIILTALKGKRQEYGKIRLFGSIGYLLVVTFIGQIFYRFGLNKIFVVYALVLFTTLMVSISFPVKGKGLKTPKLTDLKLLFRNRQLLYFFIFIFLIRVTLATHLTFFPVYFNQLADGKIGLLGFALALWSLSEIPIFYGFDRFLRRFSYTSSFILGTSIFTLRWILQARVTLPIALLLVQSLHGLSSGLIVIASVTFVDEIVSKEFRTTGQTLLQTVNTSISAIIGNIVGGYLFEKGGAPLLFNSLAVTSVVALMFFI